MNTINTRGVVVQRRPDHQDDCLVMLYTKKLGLVWARAKSAYKLSSKLRAHLEPLKEIEVMLVNMGTVKTLAQAITRESLYALHPTLYHAQCALLKAAIECAGVRAYDVIVTYLRALKKARSKKEMESICTAALLCIADAAGCGLHISSCVECHTTSTQQWYISAQYGGFVCQTCCPAGGKKITPAIMLACSIRTADGVAWPYVVDHIRWHTHKNLPYLSTIRAVEKQMA